MTQLDWQWLTLSQACQRLKSGQASALELTQASLARAHALSDQTHGFARLLEDDALDTARRLDDQRASGEPLGLLHGVPIGIKDLLFTQGVPTASGTRVMADFCPQFDATVVTRLRQAGAVLLGKTQLTEGAFGAHHPEITAPVNPWDKNLWSGVSSSGSGVAVAAGLVFAAIGSDTGGSIRFPSASCGLVGLKPTYGRVSLHGAFPLANSLDHLGPMTRSVEDAARLLCVLAGHDPQDPNTIDAPVPNYLQALCTPDDGPTPLVGMRIGIDWSYVSDGVDPYVVEVTRQAIRQFAELGAQIIEVEVPSSASILAEAWGISCGVECAQAHADYYPQQQELYGPVLKGLIELGLRTSVEDYQALQTLRASFAQQLSAVLNGVDAIIAPCMPLATPSVADMEAGAPSAPDQADFLLFTAPYDYSGHPTLTLPVAGQDGGPPGSFQLIGARLGEETLLRLGSAFEQAALPLTYPELLR
jgi:amidase